MTVREPALGLPHIYADTDAELARENGRETTKDRLGQLVLLSRVSRGTLYQAFGLFDPSTLEDDVQARAEGYTSSELNAMFAKLPVDSQSLILEYCKGVNDTIDDVYAGTLPEPMEVHLLKDVLGLGNDLFGNATNISDQVDPYYKAPGGADPDHPNGGFQFTPELAVAIGVLEIRNFGSEDFGEVSRLNELNDLLAKLPATGDEIWDDLNFLNDPLAPVSVPDPTTPGFGGPLAKSIPGSSDDSAAYIASFPSYDYDSTIEPLLERRSAREEFARSLGAWPAMGSYAWMIDAARSASGNPWIGGFPQTGIQTPSIMHFVENRSAEGTDHRIQSIGMEFIGGPFILIGQTDTVAYTTTTAQLKNNDFYLDRLILENADALRYNDEGTPAAVSMRSEILKGPTPSSVIVWRTHERGGNGGSRTVEGFQGDVSGTAESGTLTSLDDTGAFAGKDFSGGYVAITAGTGVGQIRPIDSNIDDTLTLAGADSWTTTPDDTSEYTAAMSGRDIVLISRERVFWLEESTTLLGFSMFQRAEDILDVRRAVRLIPNTHNYLAADNQPFNGIGTDLSTGNGNIGYWSAGFSRVRQGASPTDTRLPMDGSVANELVVVSGTVGSATANTLTATGLFADKDFSPPGYNYRLDNPTEKGSEYIVAITSGSGYKQTRRIAGNDDDTLTLEEDWGVTPSIGDSFEVYEIVAIPEAINPSSGYSANWNNKAATADDGRDFGRQFRSSFILERLAADNSWTRNDQRQLNKDVAGLDGSGKLGRYLVPRLREAVDGVGSGGNPDVDTVLAALEAHNGAPEYGRYFIDPVWDTTTAGELTFLKELGNDLATAIYGDEFAGSGVSVPRGQMGWDIALHAIDSVTGNPAGSYAQKYIGDYFNGQDWRVVVRDTFAATITELSGIPADLPRPNDTYKHPLSALYPTLAFDPTPQGNRGVWEQIIEVGPVVLGEFVFPLGQSGFIDTAGIPDPNAESLHPIWREWRFTPMLHVAEDLATDPDGDVDNDGVLDGYEKWYFGSNSLPATDDSDGDGASMLAEFLQGSDPTSADTEGDGYKDLQPGFGGTNIDPNKDNCPLVSNADQLNSDGGRRANGSQVPGDWASSPSQDIRGDTCDRDADNDGRLNRIENESSCPFRLTADSDSDRALDGYEISAGKDPCSATSKPVCSSAADADGDGFTDCIEHMGYNTCAVAADSTPVWSTCSDPVDSDGDACADWIEIVDVNGNRKADINDVMFVAKRALGLAPASDSDPVLDMDKNGSVNTSDALMAAKNSVLVKPHSACGSEG